MRLGLAQFAGSDRIADGLVVVVKAAHEADLQLNACLLHRSECFLDLCQLGVDRLLAEDVLPVCAARMMKSACVAVEEQMNTASMVGSPKIISGSS